MIDIADHPAPAHDPALVAIVLVEDDDPDDFDIAIVEDDADDEAVAARTEFSWTVRFTVSGTWVADGFDLDHERAMTMLRNDLSYAHEHEVSAQVLEAPPPAAIQAMQGAPPADPRPSTLTDDDLQQRIAKAAVDLADRRVTKIDFLNKEFARDTDTDLLARRCAALARAAGYGAEVEGYRGSGCCVMLSRRRPV